MSLVIKIVFLHIIAVLFTSRAGAQLSNQLLGAAGASFSGTSFSIDFSIGEVFTTSLSSGPVLLTQGFQQPYHINMVSLPPEQDYNQLVLGNEINIAVFPNPFSSTITIRKNHSLHLECVLLDITGRKLKVFELADDTLLIDLSELSSGKYHLRFTDEQQNQFSTSIIKIH
jgi:hypothetical protein